MARQSTTFEDLAAHVSERVERKLAGPVARRVEAQLTRNAGAMAAGEKSRSTGGIADPKNVLSAVSNNGTDIELEVRNIARPQKSYFGTPIRDTAPFATLEAQWINNGEWMDIKKYYTTGQKEKRPKRPFVDKTQQDVDTVLKNTLLKELKAGLT